MRKVSLLVAVFTLMLATAGFARPPISGGGGDGSVAVQRLDPGVKKSRAVLETIGPKRAQKSLASGLSMSGVFTYSFSTTTAAITLDRVSNGSASATGTLQLSLWATPDKPDRGGAVTGYRLATFPTLGELQPSSRFTGIAQTSPYVEPPDGSYWLVLVLSQYDPAGCPGNADGYCVEDTLVSFTQVDWGNALPSFNYSDLWWTSTEAGWGISILQHPSNTIFAAWFTYDDAGNPKWYVASDCQLVGDYCYGTLYETHGPPFSQPFDPSGVSVIPVGTVSFTFTGYGTAVMTYDVDGVVATKQITRQPF